MTKKVDTSKWKCRVCKAVGTCEITGEVGNVYYTKCKNITNTRKVCNAANIFPK